MEDAGVSTLHIASADLIVGQSLPGTVSRLVSVFPDKARSFEYRPPVRSHTMQRVRADRVDHALSRTWELRLQLVLSLVQ